MADASVGASAGPGALAVEERPLLVAESFFVESSAHHPRRCARREGCGLGGVRPPAENGGQRRAGKSVRLLTRCIASFLTTATSVDAGIRFLPDRSVTSASDVAPS